MKNYWIVCLVVGLALSIAGYLAAQAPAENPLVPYIPKNLKPYYLELLVKTDKLEPPSTPEETGARM